MLKEETIKKLDELNIVEEYKTKTYIEIEKEFGISRNTVWEYIQYKNIPSRNKKRRECLREPAPVGEKFGLWTVISDELKSGSEVRPGSKERQIYWKVKCECGEVAWKNSMHLKRGDSTRCKRCGNKTFLNDKGETLVNAVIQSKVRQVRYNAQKRKKVSRLDFNITPEYINQLYEINHTCALSGLDLTIDLHKTLQQQQLSIDRIDSNVGYVEGNVELVDKRINLMKGSLSNEEFIELCCYVALHNQDVLDDIKRKVLNKS